MTIAHAEWPPPHPRQRPGQQAKGLSPRPVQRPQFTATVNASRSAVHAHGELDVLTVDLLRGAIEHLRALGHDHITVDLAGVICIDAGMVRVLGGLRHAAGAEGVVVVFLDMPEGIAAAGPKRPDQAKTVRPLVAVADDVLLPICPESRHPTPDLFHRPHRDPNEHDLPGAPADQPGARLAQATGTPVTRTEAGERHRHAAQP